MAGELSDHDLLITLHTKVDLYYKEQNRRMEDHVKDDTTNFTTLRNATTALHARLDGVEETAVRSAQFKESEEKLAKEIAKIKTSIGTIFSLKDKVIGGFAVVSFLIGVAGVAVAIIKG